jgi:hypothetical protein
MPRSVRFPSLVALVVLATGPCAPLSAATAVRPLPEQNKIDHLIGEVKGSPATFLRNGAQHTGIRAAAHLARKLRFAGKRVQTARDFIVGIASKSEQSGKPYEIRWPDGRRQPLAEWLMARLALYEKEHPAPASR